MKTLFQIIFFCLYLPIFILFGALVIFLTMLTPAEYQALIGTVMLVCVLYLYFSAVFKSTKLITRVLFPLSTPRKN